MSDFLGSLIARSTDRGEVVQPRPTSVFEPSPLAGIPDLGEPPALEGTDDEAASWDALAPTWPRAGQPASTQLGSAPSRPPEPDRPKDLPLLPQSTTERQKGTRFIPSPAQPGPYQPEPPLQPTEPARSRDRSDDRAKQASPQDVAQGDAGSNLEPAPRQVTVEHIFKQSAPAATPAAPADGAPSDDRPEHESHQGLMVERLVPASVRPAPPARQTKTTTSDGDGRQASQPAHPHPTAPPAQAGPTTIVAAPEIVPYLEPVAPARIQAAPAEPGPTIQVTIGRVEVRATPAPAARKKTRSSPPVMSLDEYLRQRSGGGRP